MNDPPAGEMLVLFVPGQLGSNVIADFTERIARDAELGIVHVSRDVADVLIFPLMRLRILTRVVTSAVSRGRFL